MEHQFDLSIIIPVYNVEKYLERCLSSIYSQNCKKLNFEVITINDGSLDDSIVIQKAYEVKYPNFKTIITKNQGAGSARNRGLESAKGKFIWFVDADDFVEPNSLEFIYKNSILKNQSIGFNYNKFKKGRGITPARKMLDKESYTKTFKGLDYTYGNRSFFLWIIILKRELIEKNKIRFIENIKNIEDFDFVIKYYSLNDEMVFFNERLYNYNCDNDMSTSRDKSKENLKKLAEDSFIVHKDLLSANKNNNLTYWIVRSIVGFFISLIKYYPEETYKYYINLYNENRLLPLKKSRKLTLKYKIFSILLNKIPLLTYKITKWLF